MPVRIGVRQRQARLARRHRLAPAARADSTVEAAAGVLGLHATDPVTVYLSVAARVRKPDTEETARALYDDRTVVRMLGMRRTLFVVPRELEPVVQVAASRGVAAQQHKLLIKQLVTAGVEGDVEQWLRDVAEATYEAVATRGPSTAAELSAAVPALRTALVMAPGKPYEAKVNITSRVLLLLGAQGRIVRGRPGGGWSSRLYQWTTRSDWLSDEPPAMTVDEACVQLVRRWLETFGPAPVSDLKWWTGWGLRQTRKALAQLDVSEVDLDGTPGVVLTDDLDPEPAVRPWAALLPALDPTPMGWQQRGWFLGEHKGALFDTFGNIGPTLWWDGRIVGGWAQAGTGEIAYRLLEDVGADAVNRIEAEVERLAGVLGDRKVLPTFRTPLEKELSA